MKEGIEIEIYNPLVNESNLYQSIIIKFIILNAFLTQNYRAEIKIPCP